MPWTVEKAAEFLRARLALIAWADAEEAKDAETLANMQRFANMAAQLQHLLTTIGDIDPTVVEAFTQTLAATTGADCNALPGGDDYPLLTIQMCRVGDRFLPDTAEEFVREYIRCVERLPDGDINPLSRRTTL